MQKWTVVQAVILVFSSAVEKTNGQSVSHDAELHSTVDLPCIGNICPASTISVQWHRGSNQDGDALAWWFQGERGNSSGFSINEDFSMTIHNVTLTHKGLYQCIVTVRGGADTLYYVNLDIYANPHSFPLIGYLRQTDGFNVTCSVSHVFPEIYPELMSHDGKPILEHNEDGTYNTIVSHLFPPSEKNTTIACQYVSFNYKGVSSLLLPDSGDQLVDEDQVAKNVSCPHHCQRSTTPGVWMVYITLILEICILIIILYYRISDRPKHGISSEEGTNGLNMTNIEGSQGDQRDPGENGKDEEPMKAKRILSFGKPSLEVVKSTIQIILLVAYLAVSHRSDNN